MSHKMHSGEMTPAEALAAARDLGRETDDNRDLDTSTDAGREAVREFVETLESGETVRVPARRIHVALGATPGLRVSTRTGRVFERGDADVQSIGRTLAAMARGVTPDDYLPHVSVEQWDDTCDGGPTTWEIEVGADE